MHEDHSDGTVNSFPEKRTFPMRPEEMMVPDAQPNATWERGWRSLFFFVLLVGGMVGVLWSVLTFTQWVMSW